MVTSMQDFMVLTRGDLARLPKEGLWEVVNGRAILLPTPEFPHQLMSVALIVQFQRGLGALGYGYVVPTVDVFIPVTAHEHGAVRARVPDIVVSKHRPAKLFEVGDPPELVIEILSTRRGNVERTEKVDDYSRAGIAEYWVVNPFTRSVEVYKLKDGQYTEEETTATALSPATFPGLEIELKSVWAVLD